MGCETEFFSLENSLWFWVLIFVIFVIILYVIFFTVYVANVQTTNNNNFDSLNEEIFLLEEKVNNIDHQTPEQRDILTVLLMDKLFLNKLQTMLSNNNLTEIYYQSNINQYTVPTPQPTNINPSAFTQISNIRNRVELLTENINVELAKFYNNLTNDTQKIQFKNMNKKVNDMLKPDDSNIEAQLDTLIQQIPNTSGSERTELLNKITKLMSLLTSSLNHKNNSIVPAINSLTLKIRNTLEDISSQMYIDLTNRYLELTKDILSLNKEINKFVSKISTDADDLSEEISILRQQESNLVQLIYSVNQEITNFNDSRATVTFTPTGRFKNWVNTTLNVYSEYSGTITDTTGTFTITYSATLIGQTATLFWCASNSVVLSDTMDNIVFQLPSNDIFNLKNSNYEAIVRIENNYVDVASLAYIYISNGVTCLNFYGNPNGIPSFSGQTTILSGSLNYQVVPY